MPSLWNENERAAIVARVTRVTPQHQRAWGKMETSQVLAHLADGLRMALGDIPTKQQGGLISTALMRYLIIHKLPWPKGKAQAPPEAFTTSPLGWEEDRAALLRLIERFATARGKPLAAHSANFGRMKPHDWDVLMYRHLDHHLTQFGV
jgi:hypothetical protein